MGYQAVHRKLRGLTSLWPSECEVFKTKARELEK